MRVKVITYEEERLEFFTKQMKLAQKRYHRLFKQFRDAPVMSDGYEQMCDAGRESNFYCDVVEMLEKQTERRNNNAE